MYFNFGIIIPQNNEQIIAYFVAAKKNIQFVLDKFFGVWYNFPIRNYRQKNERLFL